MMGKVIMSGIVPPLVAPISGILASDLAVGSVVKLMEGGVATEYIVVNHGKPSGSSLYDDSCDGLWLLRKDIKEQRQWNSANWNDYEISTINEWLNGDFFNTFGSVEKSAIKQVKIPYRAGSGYESTITSGSNGLPVKIFLLSAAEINWSSDTHSWIPNDGASLNYFSNTQKVDSKRIAYLNGTVERWWLRDPTCYSGTQALNSLNVYTDGSWNTNKCSESYGIRPALILPSTAVFDEETLILKGVA